MAEPPPLPKRRPGLAKRTLDKLHGKRDVQKVDPPKKGKSTKKNK